MTIFDFMMTQNFQAAMDGVEDPPASIFVNRQLTVTSRARAFNTVSRSAMGDACLGLPEGARSDQCEEKRDDRKPKVSFRRFLKQQSAGSRPQSKRQRKGGEQCSRGDRDPIAIQQAAEGEGSPGGQEPNPLLVEATMDFSRWPLCLPR